MTTFVLSRNFFKEYSSLFQQYIAQKSVFILQNMGDCAKNSAYIWRNPYIYVSLRQVLTIMEKNIIGRREEIDRLKRYMGSSCSEFVAIYGRRRIGKTFLVRELFEEQFTFRVTGKENASTADQLENFGFALGRFFGCTDMPGDWSQAFRMLSAYIEQENTTCEKLIFIDELPWFDTYGAKFVSALEHFWNDWAAYRRDIKLIVCGSATTWMLDNVVNSRGGLHNRTTHTILLSPFTLHETEQYFHAFGFPYERQELIECYMAVGGVAYYLSLFEQDKSVAQNIDSLCFTRGGELVDEFQKLFKSLFKKTDNHLAVIAAMYKKGMGMTRLGIIEEAHLPNNGNLTRLLRELEECSFIRSFIPYKRSKKDRLYQLIDPFTLFYLRFMKENNPLMKGYWQKMQTTPAFASWCGHAFEIVCLNHLEQIVRALGIDGTINTPCSWIYRVPRTVLEDDEADEDLKHGAQIDLLIDRSDKTINICEMKYSQEEYEITKSYDTLMNRRIRTFRKVTNTRKSIISTFITPNGLLDNVYARRMPRQVTGSQLFE